MLAAVGSPADPGLQFGIGGLLLTVFGTVLVAVLTTAGVVYTARQSRSAQNKTTEIEGRRLKLEENEQRETALRDYADRLEREIERLERLGHERAREQAIRCRAELRHLADSLQTLVTVVKDEVAEEAARDAIASGDLHLTTDHPEDDDLQL